MIIMKYVVVSWLARAEQACVAVEVIISFDWAHNIGVYDRARVAVPAPVTVAIGPREEGHFVVLGNNNKCDCGFETKSCTCSSWVGGFEEAREIIRGAEHEGKGEKGRGQNFV